MSWSQDWFVEKNSSSSSSSISEKAMSRYLLSGWEREAEAMECSSSRRESDGMTR